MENGSANQAAGSGIVEPPDTARRDREGFLIKGIVNSLFSASNFRLIRLPMLKKKADSILCVD